jgi:hypothetical protein
MGSVLIVVFLVVLIPIGVFVAGALLSVLLGHSLRMEGEYRNSDSELIDLNV